MVARSPDAARAERALNARSGCALVFSMLNVSACSLAVVTPLYDGATAQPKLSPTTGFAGAAGFTQHVNQVWISTIARLPDANSLPFASRSLLTWFWVGMKWSFQTPSLNQWMPVRVDSGICAVLPSEARNEPGPNSAVSAIGALSAYWESKPHWTMFVGSKLALVASLPFLSTVSFMPISRTAAMSHGLPWYMSPTLVGGYGSFASSNSFLLYQRNEG